MTAEPSLHPRDRWFEDWSAGDSFTSEETYVMAQDRMIEFAAEFDPQPFHTDPVAAADTSFGQLVASGWHTGSALMRLNTSLLGQASMGAFGVDELRWHQPVVPGDELQLTWTIEETRRSSSKPDRGIVRVRQELKNQRGDLVMSQVAIMLMRTRAANTAAE
ncbi:MAG: MaoC family dehydratase [Actinomycetota bacterium]